MQPDHLKPRTSSWEGEEQGTLNNSAHHRGGGGVPAPPPPPRWTPPQKYWAKFSSRPSADQTFSLAPLVPISLDQKIFSSAFSASKNSAPPGGGGGGGQGRRGNQNSGKREPEWSGWQSVRMGGSDNKGDGLASQPRRYRVPGQPLLNRHPVGGVCLRNRSGSPSGADQP